MTWEATYWARWRREPAGNGLGSLQVHLAIVNPCLDLTLGQLTMKTYRVSSEDLCLDIVGIDLQSTPLLTS